MGLISRIRGYVVSGSMNLNVGCGEATGHRQRNGHSLVISLDIDTWQKAFSVLYLAVYVCEREKECAFVWRGVGRPISISLSSLKESGNLVRKRLQMDKALTSNFTIKQQRDEFTTALLHHISAMHLSRAQPQHHPWPRAHTAAIQTNSINPACNVNTTSDLTSQTDQKRFIHPFALCRRLPVTVAEDSWRLLTSSLGVQQKRLSLAQSTSNVRLQLSKAPQ